MRSIKKDFFGNQVLTDISFTLREGEVLGLVGENGAGKSTLMKILFGMDVIRETGGYGGDVLINGEKVTFNTPFDALAAGIGSMMADLIGGYMAWVPGTFAIKALTALLGGWLYHRMAGKGMNTITRVVLCGIPAEIVMVLGYFVYEVGMEVVIGSSMGAAAAAVVLGVPMNIVQGIAGIIVGAVLLPVLSHASAEMGEKIRA